MSASDTRANTKSKARKIKELYGKKVAVIFKKTHSTFDNYFTVWGVVIPPAVGETLAKIKTFKGNIYLLEPSNVESIGLLRCSPNEIQY